MSNRRRATHKEPLGFGLDVKREADCEAYPQDDKARRVAMRCGPLARAHVSEEILCLELTVRGLLLVRLEVRICLVQSV